MIALVVFVSIRDDQPTELDINDDPLVTTTVSVPDPDQTSQPAAAPLLSESPLVADFIDSVNSGDVEAAMGLIDTEASCATGLPGSENCGDFWGNNIGIGGQISFSNCEGVTGLFEERCDLEMTSELHSVFGYAEFSPGGAVLLRTDNDGRLIPFPRINPSGAFLDPSGTADFRLWEYMAENYPELNVNLNFGPNPYDYESGLAMLAAATTLNDPVRLLREVEEGLAAGGRFRVLVNNDAFSGFLDEVSAVIDFECAGQESIDGEASCPATVMTDIHAALGQGPTQLDVGLKAQGGDLKGLDLDLTFFDDLDEHDVFIEFARSIGVGFTNAGEPIFNLISAPEWVSAAAEYAAR